MNLLFIVALAWVLSRGWDNASGQVRRHVAARRAAVPDKHKRAAARQAWLGGWLREIFTGFHNTRQGLAAGWHDHRSTWGDHRVAAAKRKAEHAEQRVRWQALTAAHIHRLEIAAAKYREGPSMSDQLRHLVEALRQRLDPQDQQPAPAPDPGSNGHRPPPNGRHRRPDPPDPPDDDDDDEPYDPEPPDDSPEGEQPVTTPSNSGGGGDATFHKTNEICEQAVQQAEAAGAVDVEACTQLADALAGVIDRDDSETLGKAHDAAAKARNFEKSRKEMIEAVQALRDRNVEAYGPSQDAHDSTGVAPQPEYVKAG